MAGIHAQQGLDGMKGRIFIEDRVIAQEFPYVNPPLRVSRHHVGKGTATVYPKRPWALYALDVLSHVSAARDVP